MIGIVGPTAIGKTAVGIAVALALERCEIVSLDSMQVFRYMDIGTAKPTAEEQATIPISMIDVAHPDQEFTLADFQALAHAELERIAGDGHAALLVGGTGLYFRALTTRLDIPESEPDPALRAYWHGIADTAGTAAVRARLLEVDATAAARIHENDVRRMVRAIEVFEKTGTPLSEWHRINREAAEADPDRGMYFALNCDRNELYRTIERRVDSMVRAGFVDEVKALRDKGYGTGLKPMQALGYRQVNDFLDNKISLEEAIVSTKAETRQFARRQLIWFRADKRLQWIDTDGQTVKQIAERILASVKNKQSTN